MIRTLNRSRNVEVVVQDDDNGSNNDEDSRNGNRNNITITTQTNTDNESGTTTTTENILQIVSSLTPELFFDLVSYDAPKSDKINFSISYHHNIVFERLKHIIYTQNPTQLIRGILNLGLIAISMWYKTNMGVVGKVVSRVKDCRLKFYESTVDELADETMAEFKHVVKDSRDFRINGVVLKGLVKIANEKWNNKYARILFPILIPTIQFDEFEKSEENKRAGLHNIHLRTFQELANSELDDRCFKLRRDTENIKFQVRIPKMFNHMNWTLLSSARMSDTPSECYRGAFVVGLYVISCFIASGRIQELDEFHIMDIHKQVLDVVWG